jgi:hypothetical protein
MSKNAYPRRLLSIGALIRSGRLFTLPSPLRGRIDSYRGEGGGETLGWVLEFVWDLEFGTWNFKDVILPISFGLTRQAECFFNPLSQQGNLVIEDCPHVQDQFIFADSTNDRGSPFLRFSSSLFTERCGV